MTLLRTFLAAVLIACAPLAWAATETPVATRVSESTSSTGTGTFNLAGPSTGFRSFVSGVGDGNNVLYHAVIDDGSEWEFGYGTVTDATPDTLSRDTVFASSNSDAKVNFSESPTVFIGAPAEPIAEMMRTSKGSSRPVWLPQGGLWADDSSSPVVVYYYDGTDDIAVGNIDESSNTFTAFVGSSAAGTAAAQDNGDAALVGLTTQGDILYHDASGLARLAAGTSGHFLQTQGAGANPQWAEAGLPRSYLAGLELANNATDADHDLDIAVGEARNADNDGDLELTSALTKQIDANWAAGDDAGGIASGISLSTDTWYHVHAVDVSGGSDDVCFDTSLTATNCLSDTGGSEHRRLGSVLTDGSSNIIAFSQEGDEFLWDSPIEDRSASNSTSATLVTLSTPLGVRATAIVLLHVNAGAGGLDATLLTSPDVSDVAATAKLSQQDSSSSGGSSASGAPVSVRTNTSSQIRERSETDGGTTTINTLGWIDRRGRDD